MLTNLANLIDDFNMDYDSGDPWGSVMAWRFEIADELYRRGDEIPAEWEYRPGAGGPDKDGDEFMAPPIKAIDSAGLRVFGNLMLNFANVIKAAGQDY